MTREPVLDIHRALCPGLLRRLASVLYDSLVLIALAFLAAGIAVAINRGEAVKPGNLLFSLSLTAIPVVFFLWFWTHGGQTLGMKAWRLVLVTDTGAIPGTARAALRLATSLLSWAPFGLGYLWVLVDPDHLAWHDRLSGTRLVLVLPTRPTNR